ncbi:outer envelope protein 61-like isoform X2 [Rhododendron vialii]|uniref:outer envelope protein 61-like isoform X2 n=1 Tax=Rhododendron vialii TaxID=182163 RepID=UPI00265E4EE5|nr:outer envelope protein 61-like isoform X2 [Rhododendron vialii]
MMNPELIKLAQEQMSRMSPDDLARIQQQIMSNPELMRMASESMKNTRPEDLRSAAEQLKYAHPEQMTEIGEKMANSTPEEIAAMRAHVHAQSTYEINAAQMLKKQGNELHNQGMYNDALQKYLLAKKNLKDAPSSEGRTILLACSRNMMSCYLKTRQYEECIKEGTEVLAHDANNVKALYRRGQAYKELGLSEAAVSDFSRAHKVSPDDETIADVLRDAKERFEREGGGSTSRRELAIEEITEEEHALSSDNYERSTGECSMSQDSQPQENSCSSNDQPDISTEPPSITNSQYVQVMKDDPEALRFFQSFMSDTDPETLAAMSGRKADGVSPDMIKTASNVIGNISPEELQRMLQLASSFHGENSYLNRDWSDSDSNSFRLGPIPPDVTPDMLKMASEMMSNMPAEELQKMFQMATFSLRNDSESMTAASDPSGFGSDNESKPAETSEKYADKRDNAGESSSAHGFSNSRITPQSSSANPVAEFEEQMRNQMNDPAMRRQMYTSMLGNLTPEIVENMTEQFRSKLSQEDVQNARQAMSSLSPGDLDEMMRWADRIQRGLDYVRKTKDCLLGKPGMVLAVLMILLAILLHWLGYIGS